MKKILLCLMLVTGLMSYAQVYNNEWIDYSKTYYKFKLLNTGIYRISQSVLASAGLSNTPAEYFQLWHNGIQVPIYTSLPTGPLTSTDYIEFWGQQNDGKPDKELYRDPTYQLNDKWSLETDTSTYFLTVNAVVSNNLRLSVTPNNIAGNTLPAEPYFIYTAGQYYKDEINPGYAVNVGEYLYSSSYDKGEGYTSQDIGMSSSLPAFTFNGNLSPYNGGPSPKFKIGVFGNAVNIRQYQAKINNTSVITKEVDFFTTSVDSVNIPYSTISSGNVTVSVTNLTGCNTPPNCPTYDALDVAFFELTYARKFDFGGLSNFEFNLPANGTGNFLQISNFSFGGNTPVLYDVTNGARYVADMTAAPMLQFVLQPSSTDRHLILVSEDVSNINNISAIQTKNFINYTATANQGDYIIITNPILFNGINGTNPVDDYRAYRASAAGGGFSAKIFLADEIIDQFGFGINRNPAGIRDFLRYARNKFNISPKFVFIIGKGVCYNSVRDVENDPNINALALVPTFGYPASDVLFTADPGSSLPMIPIGRLSVINPSEVTLYLKKVKDQEVAQATQSPTVAGKAWVKNVVHITGTSEPGLQAQLDQDMAAYRKIISDTLFGANVTSFSKTSANEVDQINSTLLKDLFAQGITLITYFGHSSSTTLEFNLDNPENYNNYGKYPLFIGLGCNAGNFFDYNPSRLQVNETLSERYVLSSDRGTIGFIASTHFGIVQYLDIWNTRAYNNIANKSYGKSIGEIMINTAKDVFDFTTQEDFIARSNVEESELHGDPAIKLNPQPKPDYVVEDQMVKVSPGFVSVGDRTFKVDAKFLNLGKAINKNIVIEVKRTYPNQKTVIVVRDTIPGIRYADSISINIPIDPIHDKGLNRITVTVDADNAVDEIFETNNSITKDVMIYENEATPIYPYNFGIVNRQNIKLFASTANPFSASKLYHMELDTTLLFNSPKKIAKTLTSSGGILEFDPQTTFIDSTVYYWRVAPDTTVANMTWNNASFVFIAGSDPGFNQSHYFQHIQSNPSHIILDPASRNWVFDSTFNSLFVKNGVFFTATNQEGDLVVSVNGDAYIRSACVGFSLIFNIFDPRTFKPWLNLTGRYGSALPCLQYREHNFEWSYMNSSSRKQIMDFMDSIPIGSYVVVRNILNNGQADNFAKDWMADTTLYGSNNDLYHKLKAAGMANLDGFDSPKAFAFIYQKGVNSFTPLYAMSQGMYDEMTLSTSIKTPDSSGAINSPQFGPAKAWKQLFWNGATSEFPSNDFATVDVVGIKNDGTADTVIRALSLNQQKVDISSINAKQYPYILLHMNNMDSVAYTPYQLKSWRVTCVPAPEGGIAPNIYVQMKDTFDVAEPFDFKVAFKNVSDMGFDSLKVKLIVTDRNNVQHALPLARLKPLTAGDTVIVHYSIDTKQIVGFNSLYIEVNPDNDQPEQYHFNNYAYKSFYVRGDTLNPLMDVTFDNVHILNNDIVSAKPNVVIQLKDEAKWNLLNDPSVMHVQVKFPDGSIHPYNFGTDTLQFVPAQQAPNKNNTAQAIFKPYFTQDGTYTLMVSGQDMSKNQAGNMQYQVNFQVINKPMISNMLNYPNPFTSSTAFVFTVTGSEVPQNIKVQILTITGKIIREITKDELGPLHIGRNITEFKWDGTDQYGQKVGRGVYLYHVVTNLNGKSLDKYTSDSDNTDKYFIKGYGKMYYLGAN